MRRLRERSIDCREQLEKIYGSHAEAYARMEKELTAIHTPDAALNDAFSWAAISIEQLKAKAQPSGEVGLVAGYYASGDSARPGFGWFFGRDALYTLYAVNGFGDFALARQELEFLIARQREDGKVMHEYSQTAAFVDWKSLPYMYAAADSTPLFLTAMLDYVRSSGDVDFLRKHRDAVERAWRFETTPRYGWRWHLRQLAGDGLGGKLASGYAKTGDLLGVARSAGVTGDGEASSFIGGRDDSWCGGEESGCSGEDD